jgi:hypothetical protein
VHEWYALAILKITLACLSDRPPGRRFFFAALWFPSQRMLQPDRSKISAEHMRRALDAVADISDHIQRRLMEARIAAAVRGVVPKGTVVREVSARRREREGRRQDFCRQNHEAELRGVQVDTARLIDELETFFGDRAHLPQGAAQVLSYFALNTWTFKLFDTVPYLLLESAVPGCGKSTVIRLLEAISCRSRKASSLSEAVMFRLIDAEAPTLLIDEVVGNVHKFVAATLLQLRARLVGKDSLAGNWSFRELVDRLEQVGVVVEIESTKSSGLWK